MADIKIQLYKKTGSNFDSILLQNADWHGIPNKPSTYTPTAHTHTISNITNLQSTLNSKQATLVSGTNIKTINGNSLLGSGNITIDGGSGGGTGGGDAYLANTQTFTGVNTFTQNVNLNRSGSSLLDPALTFNIGETGDAKIRVVPEGHPEQSTTTFMLIPTKLGGYETLLHTGNTKTINGNSIFGSGNISISGGSTSGNWELLRSRGASSSLTSVNSGTTSGSVSLTKSISQGDVLAIELNSTSSASYNPIVLTITIQRISTNPNSYNYDYNLESFTSWTGTELRVNNFSISASGTNLYFGNKKYIKGSFSGTTINWTTNQNYTLYVGRVWRLVQ